MEIFTDICKMETQITIHKLFWSRPWLLAPPFETLDPSLPIYCWFSFCETLLDRHYSDYFGN